MLVPAALKESEETWSHKRKNKIYKQPYSLR